MKFLAISDLHYSDEPQGNYDREHRMSKLKLQFAVENYSANCDFIMNFGDTADAYSEGRTQRELFGEICSEFEKSALPFYSIIGNHDTATKKEDFCKLMKSGSRYFAFDCQGFLCVVLDACLNDIAQPFPESEIEWSDCHIDPEQLEWLENQLASSKNPVLIFSHVPFIIQDETVENPHLIVNRAQLFELFDKYGNVAAVFSGHYHPGDYASRNNVEYVIFPSICLAGNNSFAVVTVENGRVTVDGHGLCESKEFRLNLQKEKQ